MIGKLVGHYQILEKVGSGGMGEVWLAEDTSLERKVALKFLALRASSEEEQSRFIREAKTASALDHPNICTIHEIGETDDGQIYIAMAYYAGETVKGLVARGALELEEAIDIALQIGEGLARAHKEGITHRDIKSANVIVTGDGIVKIVDFGLAKLAGAAQLTRTGTSVGTAAYMSPEQIRGEDVDHRSDIWALGVVLYEMVTGQLPFKGDSDTAVIYSVLDKVQEPATAIRFDVPPGLEQIIDKAMHKDPGARYQNLDDLLTDLKGIQEELKTGLPVGRPRKESVPSIAVLPFKDLSPEQDQEYFCDGMAEEIINALSHVENMSVVARTSAFTFKDKEMDIREIGRKLNVENVVEGSIRTSGDRLRITAQLVNVSDGYHLWSENYDRDKGDVFAIQDEISLAIVENLKVELLGEEKNAIVKRHTDDVEAYSLYLKGISFSRMSRAEAYKKAVECFQQALERDPNYALAYFRLASAYYSSSFWGNVPPDKAYPKAKEFVLKALEIDDTLAEAYAGLAFIHMNYDWDWEAAEKALRKAVQLNPNSAIIHLYCSYFLTLTAYHEEAILEAKRAQELDPLSSFISDHVGNALFYAGRYDEAIGELQTTLTRDPSFSLAHFHLGHVYRAQSMREEAISAYDKAVALSGGAPVFVAALVTAHYEAGNTEQADELFDRLKQMSGEVYVPPMSIFWIHQVLGEEDEAFEWFEKAVEEHDSFLAWIRVFPSDRDIIPDEQRFQKLLDKVTS